MIFKIRLYLQNKAWQVCVCAKVTQSNVKYAMAL